MAEEIADLTRRVTMIQSQLLLGRLAYLAQARCGVVEVLDELGRDFKFDRQPSQFIGLIHKPVPHLAVTGVTQALCKDRGFAATGRTNPLGRIFDRPGLARRPAPLVFIKALAVISIPLF